MKISILKVLLLCALFTAATGHAHDGGGQHSATEPGVIERWSDRALSRMQGWITRARNKITGHGNDSMQGCGDMMGGDMGMMQDGGGMMDGMSGAQPNTQWRDKQP